jgi:OOP family OmpA-OmpF porin
MRTTIALALGALLIGTATNAGAQAYVGGSIGRSDASIDHGSVTEQFLDLGFDDASTRGDTKDFAWRAFAGYGFGPYFAIEAAYVDLGSFDATTRVDPPGTFRARTDINGYELGAVGRLPLGERFSLYARAGAFRGKTSTRYSGDGSVEVFEEEARQSKRATKPAYAVGAGYRLGDHLNTRLEWARYDDLGDTLTGGRVHADLVSVGVAYSF